MIRAVVVGALLGLSTARVAHADDEACVSAFEGAQEARLHNELLTARAKFQACVDACPAPFKAQCTNWRAEVEQYLPSIRLSAKTKDGEPLRIDKAFVDARPVDASRSVFVMPGEHVVRVETPSGSSEAPFSTKATEHDVAVSVSVAPRRAEPLPVKLREKSATPSLVLFSVSGVALLAAGTIVTYGHVRRNALEDSCAPRCEPAKVDAVRTAFWASAGLAVGGVVSGVLGYVLLPKRVAEPGLALGPGEASLFVHF